MNVKNCKNYFTLLLNKNSISWRPITTTLVFKKTILSPTIFPLSPWCPVMPVVCIQTRISQNVYWDLHFLSFWRNSPHWTMASSSTMFLDHTQRRITVGRTPLDEGSARRRDLYLKTHDIHNRQTSMPPVGFEPTISAGERPQNYALDGAAAGIGIGIYIQSKILLQQLSNIKQLLQHPQIRKVTNVILTSY
jgi:hypothetical protein